MTRDFGEFKKRMLDHISSMVGEGTHLFETALQDKSELWDLYLASFPDGTNEMFRTRTEHDCSACRHFIMRLGHVVSIKNGKITSIWDFTAPGCYGPVVKALSDRVTSGKISDMFLSESRRIGVDRDHELLQDGTVATWDHLYTDLPGSYVMPGQYIPKKKSELRSARDVFHRSLSEISVEAVETTLELIAQNTLYRGSEWEANLRLFLKHLKVFVKLDPVKKDLYAWEHSQNLPASVTMLRNHSIGVLLTDITEGMDLDSALKKYEVIVAPTNYQRPRPTITPGMIKQAEEKVNELGYSTSLGRRHATLGDLKITQVLFIDRYAVPIVSKSNPFEELSQDQGVNPKKLTRVEEVSVDTFIEGILPNAEKVEVLFENTQAPNLVSLIAPLDASAPSMFQWDNGMSWAYHGNLAASDLKQRVKEMGGQVEGVLRATLVWNEQGDNENDFDLHCVQPDGVEIFYLNKRKVHRSSGVLDVDITRPSLQTKDGVAVENIIWTSLRNMPAGRYHIFVHNYSHHGGKSGFRAEIEFDGTVHEFVYNKELRQGERVQVADIQFDGSTFTMIERIPYQMSSREIWGLETNKFVPVSVIMFSPNCWSERCVGNKHLFFMLDGCKNPESPNGFYNEYLDPKLRPHRKVFEALGSKMRVEYSDDQLSGIGFTLTQRNEVTVRVEGHVNRIVRIKM